MVLPVDRGRYGLPLSLGCAQLPRPAHCPGLADVRAPLSLGRPVARDSLGNSIPFAIPNQPTALSRLAVWWLRLGIWPERIAPAHPEQNGRHERLHLTLETDALQLHGVAPMRRAQQARFDRFRQEYNTERPHDALGFRLPTSLYTPSPRRWSVPLAAVQYPPHFLLRRCNQAGWFSWA